MKKSWILTLFCITICSISTFAQSEIQIENGSLAGIPAFGIVVNIEKPASLQDSSIAPASLRQEIIQKIRPTSAQILSNQQVLDSYEAPYLYLHVNIMDAGNGTYPYAVDVRFYQPTKLILKNDLTQVAATWHTGFVGIVSYDMLHIIPESAVDLLDTFVDEYQKVNWSFHSQSNSTLYLFVHNFPAIVGN